MKTIELAPGEKITISLIHYGNVEVIYTDNGFVVELKDILDDNGENVGIIYQETFDEDEDAERFEARQDHDSEFDCLIWGVFDRKEGRFVPPFNETMSESEAHTAADARNRRCR